MRGKLCFSILCAMALWLPAAIGQQVPLKIARVDIKHVGPISVSDDLIRANIHIRPGDDYLPSAVDDDLKNLYATGLFYNIQFGAERAPDGRLILTYVVQAKPRLTDIKLEGNKQLKDSKIRKKITSKVGEPLDEQKLFADTQAILDLYQKTGHPGTTVNSRENIDENAGRGTVTFEIHESPKVKITRVEFVDAHAFTQRELRKQVKTKRHWMWSWITSHGFYKEDVLQDDRDALGDFYRDHGYIDFEIKNVELVNPTPKTMVVRFHVYEGKQYKVGAVTFQGTTMFPTNQADKMLKLKPGAVFSQSDLAKDIQTVEDFYGGKGHIDVTTSGNPPGLMVRRVPNTDTGTMDLQYRIEEGQPSYVERIEIRGNTKTKDTVIRRELAISPGEIFDMVRVKVSQKRLEGLQYFEKVDARPEPTDVANHKNLVIGVEEKTTSNLQFGAGFSSVDSVVGFAELSLANFDLFHPPTFTGAGQKFRLRVQIGNLRQDYEMSFVEPWFMGHKLALGVDLYRHDLDYQSLNNIYDELRTGARLSLTRALGSDFLIGSVYYNIEQVGILLNSPYSVNLPTAPSDILNQSGYHLLNRVGSTLAYDTRNSTELPNAGQRTGVSVELTGGDVKLYKVQADSAWYFRGFGKGHVIEVVARGAVADGFGGDDVPFYERYYLGGPDSLRGFKYRTVSPRQPGFGEPVGGDTYWYGSAEYSVPIIEREKSFGVRAALFYDVGAVQSGPFSFGGDYDDNWGLGLRLNLPIGPLRLDYGIPIHHDQFNGRTGRFQFGIGYRREF